MDLISIRQKINELNKLELERKSELSKLERERKDIKDSLSVTDNAVGNIDSQISYLVRDIEQFEGTIGDVQNAPQILKKMKLEHFVLALVFITAFVGLFKITSLVSNGFLTFVDILTSVIVVSGATVISYFYSTKEKRKMIKRTNVSQLKQQIKEITEIIASKSLEYNREKEKRDALNYQLTEKDNDIFRIISYLNEIQSTRNNLIQETMVDLLGQQIVFEQHAEGQQSGVQPFTMRIIHPIENA